MYRILLLPLGQLHFYSQISYEVIYYIFLDLNTACGCEFHHDENHLRHDAAIEQLILFSFTIFKLVDSKLKMKQKR
jgi:hypothetical protein